MSQPSYRLIAPQANRSFVFKWEPFGLTTRWHYHPEVELIYFVKGSTTAVIGDGFYQFDAGDLVLLGANFPHVLQENKAYAQQHPKVKPFGLIMQFTEDFLGPEFLHKPELKGVRLLLKKAQRGILFRKSVVKKVSESLLQMPQQSAPRKLFSLLGLLQTLAETEAFDYLTAKHYVYDHSQDEERMRRINQHVYEHFKEKLSIAQIAAVANMTETSFCRYFKSRTLKSFTHFLAEVRIAYACKLLNSPQCSVTRACFESGFNSLSYFNRQFKSIMHMNPQQYQQWKRGALSVA